MTPAGGESSYRNSDLTSQLRVWSKMVEYAANGVRLGWLIDPFSRKVHVYRPNTDTQILDNPAVLSGDPELPGFVLDLTEVWEPDI